MKLSEFLKEDKSSEKEAQKHWDKANTDINKDWDPPSKKQYVLKEAPFRHEIKAKEEFKEFFEEAPVGQILEMLIESIPARMEKSVEARKQSLEKLKVELEALNKKWID